jgi:ribosomal protein S18 acetylase RimI-like enzyme
MNALPENLFANPVWNALHSAHRHFAITTSGNCGHGQGADASSGEACRYPADVVPFIAIASPTPGTMSEVHALMAAGESAWIIAETYVESPELRRERTLECFQMVLPREVGAPASAKRIEPLDESNADEMVALTDLAFPGFFRRRTCEMGAYFGVRSPSGDLIAMGGERLKLEGFSEISAVCTHPSFRGQALGTSIIGEIVRLHRRQGVVSFLHVGCANEGAVKLYLRMGLTIERKVVLHQVSRPRDAS